MRRGDDEKAQLRALMEGGEADPVVHESAQVTR